MNHIEFSDRITGLLISYHNRLMRELELNFDLAKNTGGLRAENFPAHLETSTKVFPLSNENTSEIAFARLSINLTGRIVGRNQGSLDQWHTSKYNTKNHKQKISLLTG
jgi:hypothetical protein